MKMATDEGEMRAEVLRYVKVGTPIEEAKEIMGKHGFKCVFERMETLYRQAPGPGEYCLICSKYTPDSNWISCDLVKVCFFFEAGAVTDVVVRDTKTCL
jgi:hypothetical protein